MHSFPVRARAHGLPVSRQPGPESRSFFSLRMVPAPSILSGAAAGFPFSAGREHGSGRLLFRPGSTVGTALRSNAVRVFKNRRSQVGGQKSPQSVACSRGESHEVISSAQIECTPYLLQAPWNPGASPGEIHRQSVGAHGSIQGSLRIDRPNMISLPVGAPASPATTSLQNKSNFSPSSVISTSPDMRTNLDPFDPERRGKP